MNMMVPCPNQECKDGQIILFVGFDIFWNDCPVCMGSRFIMKGGPEISIQNEMFG
jgi:hypothetical protein